MKLAASARSILLLVPFCFITVTVHAQDVDSLSLESLLSENVSTASKYKQSVAEAPASVTIITAEQIQRYGYTSLAELLGAVRGFYLSRDRLLTHLGTRGFNRMIDYNNRVLVLLNGHTLNDRVTGTAPISERAVLDMSMIDRVEVVRGPGSVLYGTGAMFAVVNIVTKKAPANDGLSVNAELGTLGRLKSAATFGKAFSNGLEIFATGTLADIGGPDLYFSEFDTPATNNGIAEDLAWTRYYGGHVSARYNRWAAQMQIVQGQAGIPTGDFGSLFNHPDARTDYTRAFFEVQREQPFGLDKSLTIRGFYDQSLQRLIYPFMIDIPALNQYDLRANYVLETDLQSVGTEAVFQWDVRTDNRLMIGAEFISNLETHVDSKLRLKEVEGDFSFFDGSYPFHVFSFYAQDEYQVLSNLSLTLGIRQDFYSRTGRATTPRAALVYHPFRTTTFKLLHGNAYREPSTLEMFFDGGTSLGGVLPVSPNATLKPERIRATEFVWEQHLARGLAATASIYDYKVQDLVGPVFNATDSLFWFDNVSRVEAMGFELELNSRLSAQAQLYASYSYQHTQQYEPDDAVTNSPAHLVKAGVSVDAGRYLTAAAEVFYESERRTVAGATTDAYWLADLHLATRPLGDHWRLSMQVHNAFDVEYYLPGSEQHIPDRFLQDGRTVLLRVSYLF